jgi:SAM-dependent methyltransferase
MMAAQHDDETIAFYEREAAAYFSRRAPKRTPLLDDFILRVGAGARVLELGAGGGQDAQVLMEAGVCVEPTDACANLAALAAERLGRPVRVMRFDELDAIDAYDGVWANASLLHVPAHSLADVLRRVWVCLKTGGVFFASFKAGDGEGRDALGRYYNFPSAQELRTAFEAAGAWSDFNMEETAGGGYDGVPRTWLFCTAVK